VYGAEFNKETYEKQAEVFPYYISVNGKTVQAKKYSFIPNTSCVRYANVVSCGDFTIVEKPTAFIARVKREMELDPKNYEVR